MTLRRSPALILMCSVVVAVPLLLGPNSAGQTQAEITSLAGKMAAESDRKLNEVYRRLVASIGDDKQMKDKLVAAQRAWVKFRDLECDLEGDVIARGGSMQPQIEAMGKDRLTEQRTETLEWLLGIRDFGSASTRPTTRP